MKLSMTHKKQSQSQEKLFNLNIYIQTEDREDNQGCWQKLSDGPQFYDRFRLDFDIADRFRSALSGGSCR